MAPLVAHPAGNRHFDSNSLVLAKVLSVQEFDTELDTSPRPAQSWGGYNLRVARGWESKSVEEQQAQAATPATPKPSLTPAQIASQHQRQGLMLSRQRVLQQLEAAQNARHREILQRALADLDAQLARLV